MSKGKLIVLEGLDGSGKGTQAKLLAKHLTVTNHLVREITFPDYDSDSSALVKMYLAGQFGDKPDDVNAYAASSFYAVDRYAGYKSDWGKFYEEGGILIADRYTTSNAVHQCSKLPPEQWDTFLQWLFDYEYHLLGLPAPDKVIYLQVDPAVSQRLMTARYHGDETRKDVHEKDTEYLARSRRAAEYCAAHLGWDTVHCTAGEKTTNRRSGCWPWRSCSMAATRPVTCPHRTWCSCQTGPRSRTATSTTPPASTRSATGPGTRPG